MYLSLSFTEPSTTNFVLLYTQNHFYSLFNISMFLKQVFLKKVFLRQVFATIIVDTYTYIISFISIISIFFQACFFKTGFSYNDTRSLDLYYFLHFIISIISIWFLRQVFLKQVFAPDLNTCIIFSWFL